MSDKTCPVCKVVKVQKYIYECAPNRYAISCDCKGSRCWGEEREVARSWNKWITRDLIPTYKVKEGIEYRFRDGIWEVSGPVSMTWKKCSYVPVEALYLMNIKE